MMKDQEFIKWMDANMKAQNSGEPNLTRKVPDNFDDEDLIFKENKK